jgi:hypothetical protein
MNTLQAWIKAHPGINVLAFEANYSKSFGFGSTEIVCGFCLASHYFEEEEPEICRFCRAPIRETAVISDLPEIVHRKYVLSAHPTPANARPRLTVVSRKPPHTPE